MKLMYKPGETVPIEIGGVTFVCRAPIGEVDVQISEMHAQVEAMDESTLSAKQAKHRAYRDGFADAILIGWEGEGLPEFQLNPSKILIAGVKTALMIAYQKLMIVSEEEAKN